MRVSKQICAAMLYCTYEELKHIDNQTYTVHLRAVLYCTYEELKLFCVFAPLFY